MWRESQGVASSSSGLATQGELKLLAKVFPPATAIYPPDAGIWVSLAFLERSARSTLSPIQLMEPPFTALRGLTLVVNPHSPLISLADFHCNTLHLQGDGLPSVFLAFRPLSRSPCCWGNPKARAESSLASPPLSLCCCRLVSFPHPGLQIAFRNPAR